MTIKPLHHWTPTSLSLPLSKRSNRRIYLKMECYQPAGSYKIRGIGRLAQHFIEEGVEQLVSSSGGNAGVAAAYAAKHFGVPITVFLPNTSAQIFIDELKLQGAIVKIVGDVWDEANEVAKNFSHDNNYGFIPPFDHPLIWEGHATMIDEVVNDGILPDAVVVAVGGGGLASGVLTGMSHHAWDAVDLIAVETEGAASFAASQQAGKLVTLPEINTVATSLGAKRVCQNLFDVSQKRTIKSAVVRDHQAILACDHFLDDHRALIEPSSGAALSIVYDQHPVLSDYEAVLVIVCGGVGISHQLLHEYLQKTSKLANSY